MGVTQKDISKRLGLDVSSVNKILNRRKGPVFRKETIKAVFEVAGQMGYDFKSKRSGLCRTALVELLAGGNISGVSDSRLKELKKIAGVA
jgi:DNA-binding LacI/PurR family transcriptional regulator